MASIVLIEDTPELRENILMSLQLGGHAVEAFPEGDSAIRALSTKWPDLILCDVQMPGMNGYEVLKKVRQMPGGSTVPFVFLTALAEREDVRRGMGFGADDYLPKPFSINELFSVVDSRLRSKASVDAEAEEKYRQLHELQIQVLPHEFRTPLHIILGGISLLRDEFGHLGENFDQYVGLIEEGAIRMKRTLLNFICYTQLASGRFDIPKATLLPVGETIRDVAISEATASKRREDLRVEAMEASWNIAPEVLDIAAREIISNAFKFSTAGSPVRIYMEAEDRIVVEDSGRGMTTEEIAKVGPFRQFGRDQHEQQGLGVGLAICRELEKIGGPQVELIPREEGGLKVILSLPRSAGR